MYFWLQPEGGDNRRASIRRDCAWVGFDVFSTLKKAQKSKKATQASRVLFGAKCSENVKILVEERHPDEFVGSGTQVNPRFSPWLLLVCFRTVVFLVQGTRGTNQPSTVLQVKEV